MAKSKIEKRLEAEIIENPRTIEDTEAYKKKKSLWRSDDINSLATEIAKDTGVAFISTTKTAMPYVKAVLNGVEWFNLLNNSYFTGKDGTVAINITKYNTTKEEFENVGYGMDTSDDTTESYSLKITDTDKDGNEQIRFLTMRENTNRHKDTSPDFIIFPSMIKK